MNKSEMNLKVAEFENQISVVRIKQKVLNDRLRNAYEYKDRLTLAQMKSESEIKDLQLQIFQVSNTIPDLIDAMKKEFQLYTDNL